MASRPRKKKRYLSQQAGKQKEPQQSDADKNQSEIEAAVRKMLPQVVQSVSIQEQSVHVGPVPSADEAKKYQDLLPGFMDRTLALTERLQKADIEITKREQSIRAAHSILSLLVAGGIVFTAIFLSYKMQMAGHGVWESFVPFAGALATLAGAFYGKKKLSENKEKD